MECLTVNSIRHIIGLQWNLKVKDILPDSTAQEGYNPFDVPEKTIRSALCRIKGMEDSIFHLELTSQLNVLAKGHRRWSYQLIYAFAVVKDRAFLVKETNKLKFLDLLKLDHLDSVEEVSFHCMVLVGPPAADSTSADPDLADNNEGLAAEGQVCACLEVVRHPDCKFDGEIPEFTVDKAKELITKESTNSVLKVLAMEYLIKSIKVENVSSILKFAIDQDLKVLQKQCSEFLCGCTIRRNNLSYSSLSDSVSDESESNDIYPNNYLDDVAHVIFMN
ncbi:hypothetical protein AVEN_163192-1 [Araneus ventricosus]|uniref:BTB domain-containing protein n=1 Tax=Araneus ventricosus TaxID=182803 RepID=A0A4Y2I7C3_ARAVE|nr:hypothetical protein AVEN_163192-1 [Araneus ventricosus]